MPIGERITNTARQASKRPKLPSSPGVYFGAQHCNEYDVADDRCPTAKLRCSRFLAWLSPLAAQLMSCLLFAGSSQFLLAQMAAGGVPALMALGAIALINLRHALYSASVAPVLAPLSRRWKLLLAYLLTDEAYAAAVSTVLARPTPPHAHWVLFGSGFALWLGWQLSTLAGVLLGQHLPGDLDLDFALPLTFIAIVVPMLRRRAHVIAAVVASLAALALHPLPYKLGMLAAAIAGLFAGAVSERLAPTGAEPKA